MDDIQTRKQSQPKNYGEESKNGSQYRFLSTSESPKDQHKFLLKELQELRLARSRNKLLSKNLIKDHDLCSGDQEKQDTQKQYSDYQKTDASSSNLCCNEEGLGLHQQQETLNQLKGSIKTTSCNTCLIKGVNTYLTKVNKLVQEQNELITKLKTKSSSRSNQKQY